MRLAVSLCLLIAVGCSADPRPLPEKKEATVDPKREQFRTRFAAFIEEARSLVVLMEGPVSAKQYADKIEKVSDAFSRIPDPFDDPSGALYAAAKDLWMRVSK